MDSAEDTETTGMVAPTPLALEAAWRDEVDGLMHYQLLLGTEHLTVVLDRAGQPVTEELDAVWRIYTQWVGLPFVRLLQQRAAFAIVMRRHMEGLQQRDVEAGTIAEKPETGEQAMALVQVIGQGYARLVEQGYLPVFPAAVDGGHR